MLLGRVKFVEANTGCFLIKEWAAISHRSTWLLSISLSPKGLRSLHELDVGSSRHMQAQGRCVGNNSIKSKGTAGLRGKKNKPRLAGESPGSEPHLWGRGDVGKGR